MNHTAGTLQLRDTNISEEIVRGGLLQLKEASWLQAIILVGDLNHPDICWESYTASNPGGFCSELHMTSWSRYYTNQPEEKHYWTQCL